MYFSQVFTICDTLFNASLCWSAAWKKKSLYVTAFVYFYNIFMMYYSVNIHKTSFFQTGSCRFGDYCIKSSRNICNKHAARCFYWLLQVQQFQEKNLNFVQKWRRLGCASQSSNQFLLLFEYLYYSLFMYWYIEADLELRADKFIIDVLPIRIRCC